MGIEIERKFLLKNDDWRKLGKGELYRQGYLSTDIERTVRIRTIGKKGYLTIKGITQNTQREEFEYDIPFEDANWMLDVLCKRPLIEKTRYKISVKDLIWEVDEFFGENKGLIIAEVELRDANQSLAIPEWIGREVTEDPAYYNASLVEYPYSKWKTNINQS
jgi:CYTH domain-containing protein